MLWISLIILVETLKLMQIPTGNPVYFFTSYLDSVFSDGNTSWYASLASIQLSIILFAFVAAYFFVRNSIIIIKDEFSQSAPEKQ